MAHAARPRTSPWAPPAPTGRGAARPLPVRGGAADALPRPARRAGRRPGTRPRGSRPEPRSSPRWAAERVLPAGGRGDRGGRPASAGATPPVRALDAGDRRAAGRLARRRRARRRSSATWPAPRWRRSLRGARRRRRPAPATRARQELAGAARAAAGRRSSAAAPHPASARERAPRSLLCARCGASWSCSRSACPRAARPRTRSCTVYAERLARAGVRQRRRPARRRRPGVPAPAHRGLRDLQPLPDRRRPGPRRARGARGRRAGGAAARPLRGRARA